MTTANQPDDFNDVFNRDSDMGADTATPATEGKQRDDLGRFAPKSEPPAPDAKVEAEKPVEVPKAAPQETPPPSDERADRRVPLSELLSTRERAKAAEKLRDEAEARAKNFETQLQQFQQQIHQAQRPQQQAEQPPDMFVDPQGFVAWQQSQFEERLANERANFSETRARDKFGDEAVTAAQQAAIRHGIGPQFMALRDPYGELMKWHRQASFMQKVGTDPDAYEKQLRDQAYQQALADLRSGKVQPPPLSGQQPASQAPTRFPGSLASATAAGSQGAVLTDEAVANELFDPNRKNRSFA